MLGFARDDMQAPHALLGRASRASREEDGVGFGEGFGLDEQVRERLVRLVGGLGRERDLEVRRDLEVSRLRARDS